jgi:hypothetical protein|tara:strand:- start:316 stop:525 length:210 start_codon:yes stop_codon:yes gene_type:complete
MRHIITLAFIITTGCTVSEEMIANKQLYCSGVYKGIRAVGRVATEVTTGVSIPDVCMTIDEITEDSEKK